MYILVHLFKYLNIFSVSCHNYVQVVRDINIYYQMKLAELPQLLIPDASEAKPLRPLSEELAILLLVPPLIYCTGG